MEIKLAAIFGDGMVLQRGMPVPVWGRATPRKRITVSVDGRVARTVSWEDGRWSAKLPALQAGGPHVLRVEGGGAAVELKDVLVGEVWLCSGQSNMEWPLLQASDGERDAAAANWPGIRLLSVPRITAERPLEELSGGAWAACTPESAAGFSAVGYYFGRELHRRLGVPVGLINASWGGTRAEAWTSREALLAESELEDTVADFDRNLANMDQAMAEYRVLQAQWRERNLPADPGDSGHPAGWADPATRVDDWPTLRAPGSWQAAGLGFNGVIWFRRDVDVPAAWAGRDLELSLGPCDDCDTTWFNNVRVGGIGVETDCSYMVPRVYCIPAALVRPGRNVVAVRIYDNFGNGGFTGAAAQMKLRPADGAAEQAIPLAGPWSYRVEHNFGVALPPPPPPMPMGPGNQNAPSALYNGMLAPLIPFALRGATWYQGESNAPAAYRYRTLLPAMIRDWRARWRQGRFPFLIVQLANFQLRTDAPGESTWAELREAQLMALKLPNTAMAVTIDIGAATDIHPKNKLDVGLRLARAALAGTYGRKDVVPSGPLVAGARFEGGAVRVRFTYAEGGLATLDGVAPTGFAVAGEDRKFHWAVAAIDGETVVARSDAVPKPVALRYGWADNPAANLCNRERLPASPFRTDKWLGVTRPF